MLKKTLVPVCLLAISLGAISCKKIESGKRPAGPLLFEKARSSDVIPLDYGELVSITPEGEFGATLWFQKADKTIVVVRVNVVQGIIGERVLTIPRK